MPDGHGGTRARVATGLALLLSAALALAVSGCGSSSSLTSKGPAAILAASRAAANGARSVRIADIAAQGRLKLMTDYQLTKDGGRASTSLLGSGYKVIRIANTVYVKGDAAFYRRLERSTGAHVARGAWIEGPADSGRLSSLASLTDLGTQLAALLRSPGSTSKGATTTVRGQRAIELEIAAKLYDAKLYVATAGDPYPIEIVKQGRETGSVTFTGWNRPIALLPPKHAIALSQLERAPR